MGEISELKQETVLVQEIPRRLCESVASCKEIYEDILSMMQSFVSDGKSSTAKLLSSTSDIGMSLLSTLEIHFSMVVDGHISLSVTDSLIQEQREVIRGRLKSTIASLLSETPSTESKQVKNPLCSCNNKGCTLERESACLKEKLNDELNTIKEKFDDLEKELDLNNQLLEVSRERYGSLEREFQLLKEERDSLLEEVSESSQKFALLTDQKENVLKDLIAEVQRRKDMEEEIKQFSINFACRQRSLASFHSEFKSKIEKLRDQNQVSAPKSLGY